MAKETRELLGRIPEKYAEGAREIGALVDDLEAKGKFPASLSREDLVKIEPLPAEAKKFLKSEGYLWLPLTNQTLGGMRDAGRPFYHVDPADRVLTTPSVFAEVAFHPDPKRFFLPGSNRKTLDKQIDMVKEFSEELQRKSGLTSIKAVIGEASDYADLTYTHVDNIGRKRFGDRLFGPKYGFNFTRTITPTSGFDVAYFGDFDGADGPAVDDWGRDEGCGRLFVAPLVVSASVNRELAVAA